MAGDDRSSNDATRVTTQTGEMSAEEPEFLHAVLCQVGLPRSATKERVFTRSNGSASMMIEAGRWNDGTRWEEMPLPYGTRPRLVLFHVCSEAVRTGSPEVEVENSVRGFLRRLRISEGGESMAAFKKQMRALAACRMQLAYTTGKRVINVKCDPIEQFDAWLQDEDGQGTMWPGVIRLSDKFFDTLQDYAVPLDPRAVASLQNSALALDTYTWLAHRLWRINKPSGQIIHWKSLRDQFGQEYRSDKDFKREFLGAVKKAMGVYPDARIEQIRGGVKLLPSAPPVKRKQVQALLPAFKSSSSFAEEFDAGSDAVDAAPPVQSSADVEAVVLAEATLMRAAELVSDIAMAELVAMYGGIVKGRRQPPKDMDADFLRWLRAFARGRGSSKAPALPDFRISEAARARAARLAKGASIDQVERDYRAWVARRGEIPRMPDKAFPAWVDLNYGDKQDRKSEHP